MHTQSALPAAPTLLSSLLDSVRKACSRNTVVVGSLSPFERLVAHWLFRRMLRHNNWPMSALTQGFTELSQVARTSFPEDNDPTVDFFLRDCLEKAIGKTSCAPVRPVE
jgi:hypothetical protein